MTIPGPPHVRALVVVAAEKAGGAERYLARLYAGLKQRGFVTSAIGRLPGWPDHLRRVDDSVRLGPKWSRRTLLPGLVRARHEARRVEAVARAIPHDLAHLQFKREQIAFTAPLSALSPVVWTEHGVLSPTSPLRGLYARAATHVSQVICVSDEVATSIAGLVPRDRIVVIENGIDTGRYRPPSEEERTRARADLGLPMGKKVILWAGRLDAGKRPELAAMYARRHRDQFLLIVGDGSERERIKRKTSDLTNVLVVGHVDDMLPLFHAADALMFTSTGKGEGMPTVIVEASSAGLPVVTHRGSGAESFVTGAGGAVVSSPGDMDMWGVAFDAPHLAAPEPRTSWVKAHDERQWLDQHQMVFEQLVRRPRPGSPAGTS
ncbi:glycosyltransferase [Microbacterium sp. HD4P20]|uniref:glycosyltransferase n=1 Tax=Microbacterium sp. HD4P20 TaxID=2864874 RepID=UPI001C640F40|nr:glycosyltransferase [Microbacterium sp. HD4P20]MCP2638109.1 glycosyltransferase [Microbacterium sp. HD4P20]